MTLTTSGEKHPATVGAGDDESPPLALERYAEALAYAREYPVEVRAAVLARLKITPTELDTAGAYWSRRIALALANKEVGPVVELARAYGVAERYARVQRPPVARLTSRVKTTSPLAGRTLDVRTRVPAVLNKVTPTETKAGTGELRPTYLRAPAQPAAPLLDPDVTQDPIPRSPVSLPFRRSLVREVFEEPAEQPLTKPVAAPQTSGTETPLGAQAIDVDQTAMIPLAAIVPAATGTFRDQLGSLVIPVLTLEEYAELRARLTIFGEGDELTLKRFGVSASEVREALRVQFNEQFQRDPSAQQRFLSTMQLAMARARSERGRDS
jgi:hypothetical protein